MRCLQEKRGRIDLGGLLTIGRPGQAVLDVPVSEGREGLIDFGRLFRYEEMESRLKALL